LVLLISVFFSWYTATARRLHQQECQRQRMGLG
jgi:hypothetical protein